MIDKSVDPASFKDFVGIYDYGSPVMMQVSQDGDKLFAQLTGQEKFRIYPRNKNTFFLKVVRAEVEFVRDADGKVTTAIHRQNGSESRNKRMPDGEIVFLTADQLDAYVGQYDYGNAIMTVTRKGTQLMAQLPGQPAMGIYPTEEDTFVWRVVEAKVTFKRDDSGKVTGAVHNQNGGTINAPRVELAKTIKVSQQKLKDYVGKYNYGLLAGNADVTTANGKLYAQLRGQPKLELLPTAEDKFRWKDVNASIEFVRDEDGEVTHAIHNQGGREMNVKRVE